MSSFELSPGADKLPAKGLTLVCECCKGDNFFVHLEIPTGLKVMNGKNVKTPVGIPVVILGVSCVDCGEEISAKDGKL